MFKYAAVLGIVFLAFFSEAQNENGLIAKYSFNKGNAKDEAGKNDAKAYGVVWSEDRFGNESSACYLLGNADSYLNLGTSNELKPREGTISLWVKLDAAVYKGQGIHSNTILYTRSHIEDDFNEGYVLAYHFDLRKFHCNTSLSELNQINIYPATTSYLQQWYHLVMTYDDKTLTYYVNGVMEGKAAKNFESKFLEGDSVVVGIVFGPKNKRYLHGTVDDICIYNRVLTSKEVLDLYDDPDPNRLSVILRWISYSAGILLFLASIVWIVRWRINKVLNEEKEKNQLRNNWYEQENKVLTAQMDPHFIFNSLNTIQQFIIVNENDKAQLYLTKFSRLLRMILENNLKNSISLKEEIELIKQYLEIESLRFNNVFDYSILVDEKMELDKIHLPRFLIQPFIENAIWHGLLPKEGDKHLTISFKIINEKTLSCIIEDNGVGRKESNEKEREQKNKSLAINFIRQRLELMTKLYHASYGILIIDKFNPSGNSEGTKVIATIPILNN